MFIQLRLTVSQINLIVFPHLPVSKLFSQNSMGLLMLMMFSYCIHNQFEPWLLTDMSLVFEIM